MWLSTGGYIYNLFELKLLKLFFVNHTHWTLGQMQPVQTFTLWAAMEIQHISAYTDIYLLYSCNLFSFT